MAGLLCAEGSFSSESGATECTLLEIGTTYQDEPGQAFAKTCSKCQPGSFIAVNCTSESDTECEACPEGSFSSFTSSAACSPVMLGTTYQDLPGQSFEKVCNECSLGSFLKVSCTQTTNAECEECGEGEFTNAKNTPACLRCAEEGGTSEKSTGSTYCKQCTGNMSNSTFKPLAN